MKQLFLSILILLVPPFVIKAQFLSLTDLVAICSAHDMESASEKLSSKNWMMMQSEDDDSNGIMYNTWSYGTDYSEYYDEYTSVAPGFINIISKDSMITGLYYTIFEFDRYITLFNAMKENGFKKLRSKDYRKDGITTYSDGGLLLLFDVDEVYSETDPEGSYTAYMVFLARKSAGTSGEPDGPRQEFYSTGELKAEFAIEGGEVQGLVRIYDLNGSVIQESYYDKGLLHGARKFWFPQIDQNTGLPIEEAGELYLVSNYSKGMQHGTETWYYHAGYELFPCERVDSGGVVIADTCRRLVITSDKEIINFRNDMLHGDYILYDENGEILIKGRYKKGVEKGKWIRKPEDEWGE